MSNTFLYGPVGTIVGRWSLHSANGQREGEAGTRVVTGAAMSSEATASHKHGALPEVAAGSPRTNATGLLCVSDEKKVEKWGGRDGAS